MYKFTLLLLLAVEQLVACSGGHAHSDAPKADAPPKDTSPGQCGSDVLFTGELVDWNSNDANFCGVFQASFQVEGDASRKATTAPNGRFTLCLAPAPVTTVDVTPPAGTSECTQGSYSLPGIAIANQDVINTGMMFSARNITANALQQQGLTLDPTKAYVFVHVDGTPRAVSISSSHDASLAFDGTAWSAGDTGVNVFFPNTDASAGTTTVQLAGGGIGTGTVPVVAGKFTYLTVVAN